MSEHHNLRVPLAGGRYADVPLRNPAPNQPWRTTIGPLPPEVAERYRVAVVPVPYLLSHADADEAERLFPQPDAPHVVEG